MPSSNGELARISTEAQTQLTFDFAEDLLTRHHSSLAKLESFLLEHNIGSQLAGKAIETLQFILHPQVYSTQSVILEITSPTGHWSGLSPEEFVRFVDAAFLSPLNYIAAFLRRAQVDHFLEQFLGPHDMSCDETLLISAVLSIGWLMEHSASERKLPSSTFQVLFGKAQNAYQSIDGKQTMLTLQV